MFATLEFVMVACLFASLCVDRGAQVVAWLKGAGTTVANDVKNL